MSYKGDSEDVGFYIYDLYSGEMIDLEIDKSVEVGAFYKSFYDTLSENNMLEVKSLSMKRVSANHKSISLNDHELIKYHQFMSCNAKINANYEISENGEHSLNKKSLIIEGEFTFSGERFCDIITEFGPVIVPTLSLNISKVWQIAPQLFAVAFDNHPATLYLDQSMSFNNLLNKTVNFNTVGYQVIEKIIDDESPKYNKDRGQLPTIKAQHLKQYIKDRKMDDSLK